MSSVKEHIHGVVGAIIFSILVIVLLFTLGFTTPLPLPEEEGILLDFGGGGNPNAGASSASSQNRKPDTTPNKTPDSGVNAQNFEESASMESSEVPNSEPIKETPKQEDEIVETTENTEETQVEEEPQLNSNLSNLLNNNNMFGSGSGTGNSGTGTGGGNPGLGDGNSGGSGRGPGGHGGAVGNRKPLSNPQPPKKDGMFGKVTLSYNVDSEGVVSNINIVESDCPECNPIAIATLKKWKYEKKPNSGYQTGKLTFNFVQ